MSLKKPTNVSCLIALAAGLAVGFSASDARANVYPTNIKINGNLTNSVATSAGSSVTISFILNEAATAGTTINILSNGVAADTINIASGSPGTLRGLNSVIWDGKITGGAAAPEGAYSVSITASATGYTNWTQISDDSFTNTYVTRCRAIAVINDTNNPYYGRIYVGNSTAGPSGNTPSSANGDRVGFCKYNADGSTTDDGVTFGTGGYGMVDDGGDCPLKARFGEDGRLYFNDWASGKGEIIALDMSLSSNQIVLPPANYSSIQSIYPSANWQGFDVSGKESLTNARVWLSDGSFNGGSAGVWVWGITNGAVDPNDMGVQAVGQGGDLSLLANGGVFVDDNTNIYINQYRNNAGDPANRAFEFSGFDGVTTLFTDVWGVGGGDDNFRAMYDFALDSRSNPKYLAYCSYTTPGGIRVLNAADGSVRTDLDGTITATNINYGRFYRTINWDNAGNFYAGVQTNAVFTLTRWQVYSPPGTNQATTVALATIQIGAAANNPNIGSLSVASGTVTINFTGSASDAASAFVLQSATTVSGPYTDVPSAVITLVSPGVFQATVATSGANQFYRLKR